MNITIHTRIYTHTLIYIHTHTHTHTQMSGETKNVSTENSYQNKQMLKFLKSCARHQKKETVLEKLRFEDQTRYWSLIQTIMEFLIQNQDIRRILKDPWSVATGRSDRPRVFCSHWTNVIRTSLYHSLIGYVDTISEQNSELDNLLNTLNDLTSQSNGKFRPLKTVLKECVNYELKKDWFRYSHRSSHLDDILSGTKVRKISHWEEEENRRWEAASPDDKSLFAAIISLKQRCRVPTITW